MTSLNLTAREQELLVAVVAVMQASIDWNQVAPKANFTTAKQARDKWAIVRNKITAAVGGASGDGATPTKKKATPKKRKNDDKETTASAKKAKKNGTTPAEEDEDEVGGQIKPEEDSDEGEFI